MTQLGETREPGRLRRFIAYPLTLMVIGAAMVIGALVIVSIGINLFDIGRNSPLGALRGLAAGLAPVLAYAVFGRWVERGPNREFATPGAARELGLGLLLGFVLMVGSAGLVALLGGFRIEGVLGLGNFWTMLGVALYSGPFEETLFRAVILRQLERVVGTFWALAATAAFFGFAHLANPNATFFAGFAIMMEAGILLGAAYLLTRRLWLAIGVHSAWNFTQGWLLSIPVSGTGPSPGLLVTSRTGPEWLTGGDFGLEASVVTLVVATLAGLAMLRRAWQRGEFVAPRWQRNQTKL
ncbi:CPBP family intramembrane glutamic endopeptidase [Novosphingobium album (ex Liu et al. 2023)]|uniref:Type II CAAX endopeptidase family protein n=1 Tax=Novosphingobium album (ex Liu et al. 2023) TaxID=3031130 RepID=A0ABT5WW20_9SPHN|nr:type II CAAX endopeptidase family protein [Novosphingobium album (ex Liu et al. 2023)]MDE8654106.1 type II CAAX endopeptidase family protein [Novosphingobium album (ex Liu et al. 2023)]